MQKLNVDSCEFLYEKIEGATIVFSTAKDGLNFNKSLDEGKKNLVALKQWFSVQNVAYLDQIHSDLIYNYDGEIHQGDALITDKANIAIGIFTADCVPVLIYDPIMRVIGAIHSGWKGTLFCIVLKTIEKMRQEYGSNPKNMLVFIGPHIKSCCYEVGADLIEKFAQSDFYKNKSVFLKNHLDLEECILAQLYEKGVEKHHIHSLNICTFCNKEYDLHSYRKSSELQGRLFSFIYLDTKNQ